MTATPPIEHSQFGDARAATLTAANAHIYRHVRDTDDGEQEWEFLCACGRAGCSERVFLTLDDYIALSDSGAVVLAPGHRVSQVGRARGLSEYAKALRAQAEHQVGRARKNLHGLRTPGDEDRSVA
jgi:hypothetical protein